MVAKAQNSKVIELSGPQAAAFTGYSYRQFNNFLTHEFPPPRNGAKKYPSDLLGQWLIAKIKRETNVEIHKDPDLLNGQQELARKNKELADKTMLENQVRRDELIEVDQVVKGWQSVLMNVRTRLMSIPTAAAPLLIGEDDQIHIQETLEDLVREALDELVEDAHVVSNED